MSEFDLTLDRERLAEVRHGAVLVTTEPAVFRVQGPGALTCLQGLLTTIGQAGRQQPVYGALLTPKGARVVELLVNPPRPMPSPWSPLAPPRCVARTLSPPTAATSRQGVDLTGQARVAWLIGAHGFQDAGRIRHRSAGGIGTGGRRSGAR